MGMLNIRLQWPFLAFPISCANADIAHTTISLSGDTDGDQVDYFSDPHLTCTPNKAPADESQQKASSYLYLYLISASQACLRAAKGSSLVFDNTTQANLMGC